jgi:hypothetical protein
LQAIKQYKNMALNIIINKVSVAASFAAGATVATAVASGGTAPYVYSLATGGDKFAINSSTGVVTTIAAIDINNIASFSVTATDSTTGTALTGTSSVTYPPIQSAIQNRFNKANVIYKITKDINLNGGTLTIPAGCTLDFQGGTIENGTTIFNQTTIVSGSKQIFSNVSMYGNINNPTFPLIWAGCLPNSPSIDISKIINPYLITLNAPLELGVGEYYTGELYIEKDNFVLKGLSSSNSNLTILYPFQTGQHYLIKLGGGKDTYGQKTPKIRGINISGISFKGLPNRPLTNSSNSNGVYNCGVLCIDRVEVGNFNDLSFNDTYESPCIFFGWSYELIFNSLFCYTNHVKSDCPVLFFGSPTSTGAVSAVIISNLQTEGTCGPVLSGIPNHYITEMTIGNWTHEGALQWEGGYATQDVSKDYFNTDTATKIKEVLSDTLDKVPLINVYNSNLHVNNLSINSIGSARWKNKLDNDNRYKIYSLANINSTTITSCNTTINSIQSFYNSFIICTLGNTSINEPNALSIERISIGHSPHVSSGGQVNIKPYFVTDSKTNGVGNITVVHNECSIIPYPILKAGDIINSEHNFNLLGLWVPNVGNSIKVVSNSDQSLIPFPIKTGKLLFIDGTVDYLLSQPFYIEKSIQISMNYLIIQDTTWNFYIEYYDKDTDILLDTVVKSFTTSSQMWSTIHLNIEYKENAYIKLRTSKNFHKYIDGLRISKVVSGKSSERPSLTALDYGFTYFDTNLLKYICWNGTAWVNMDGTALA